MISMVIEGEYKSRPVSINMKGEAYIDAKHRQKIMLTPENVRSFDVIEVDGKKSFTSSVVRGAVGGVLLGNVGSLAGINSAKSVNNAKIKIVFKDGKASLLHVEKHIYNAIVEKCFNLDPTDNTSSNGTGNFCTNCGAALADGVKFCGSCGASVSTSEPQPVQQEHKKTMLERSEERYQKASEKRQEADAKLQKAKDDLAQVRLQNQNKKIYTPKQVKLFFIVAVAIAAILSLLLVVAMHSENEGIGMDIFMFIFCTIVFSIPTLLGALVICLPSIKKNKKDKQDK